MPEPSYCTRADLATIGISERFLKNIDGDRQDAAISMASRTMDGYFRRRFTLPLVQYAADVTRACATLAVYDLASGEGYNPADPGDENLRLRAKAITDWLEGIAAGNIIPSVTDSSQAAAEGKPPVRARSSSNTMRGYYDPDGNGGPFSGGR